MFEFKMNYIMEGGLITNKENSSLRNTTNFAGANLILASDPSSLMYALDNAFMAEIRISVTSYDFTIESIAT